MKKCIFGRDTTGLCTSFCVYRDIVNDKCSINKNEIKKQDRKKPKIMGLDKACPKCGVVITMIENFGNYCWNCSQILDWGEMEE